MQDPRSTRIPVPVQKRPLPETLKMFDEFFPIEFFIFEVLAATMGSNHF